MLSNYLKIIHIFTASLFCLAMFASIFIWKTTTNTQRSIEFIQSKTAIFIVPFAIFQLITGFTMISLNHYPLSAVWLKGSVIGFSVLLTSWFGFVYFFTVSQYKNMQKTLLLCCLVALLLMIFFMANKI